MSSKQIKVGQRWRRRDGSVVELTAVHPTGEAFADKDCHWYDGDDGRMFSIGGRDKDLVELIEDVPPAQPASKPLFAVGMEGVTTRDGRKVRILATDVKGREPIAAAVANKDGTEDGFYFGADGNFYPNKQVSDSDMIPPPPPKQYAWLNVYRCEDGTLSSESVWDSKEGAKEGAGYRCAGRIKVLLEERWDE